MFVAVTQAYRSLGDRTVEDIVEPELQRFFHGVERHVELGGREPHVTSRIDQQRCIDVPAAVERQGVGLADRQVVHASELLALGVYAQGLAGILVANHFAFGRFGRIEFGIVCIDAYAQVTCYLHERMAVGERVGIRTVDAHVVVAAVGCCDVDVVLAVGLQRHTEPTGGGIGERFIEQVGGYGVVEADVRLNGSPGVLVGDNTGQHAVRCAAHGARQGNLAVDIDRVELLLLALLFLHLRHLQNGVTELAHVRSVQRAPLERVEPHGQRPYTVAEIAGVEQGVVAAFLLHLLPGIDHRLVVGQHKRRQVMAGGNHRGFSLLPLAADIVAGIEAVGQRLGRAPGLEQFGIHGATYEVQPVLVGRNGRPQLVGRRVDRVTHPLRHVPHAGTGTRDVQVVIRLTRLECREVDCQAVKTVVGVLDLPTLLTELAQFG